MDEMDEHYNDENDQGQQLQYKDTNQQLTTLSSLTSLSSFVCVCDDKGKRALSLFNPCACIVSPKFEVSYIYKHSQMCGVSVRAA